MFQEQNTKADQTGSQKAYNNYELGQLTREKKKSFPTPVLLYHTSVPKHR